MDASGSLNHVYRTVWNQALGAMVAVAEIAGSRRKGRNARSGSASAAASPPWGDFALSALGLAVVCLALPVVALANPSGAVAVHGQANLSSNGNNLRVTTQNGAGTNHSVINWQSFSIPAGSSSYFQQPNAASTSINRVVTSNPSLIFGGLGSNGHLVLVNQSGITVGAGAIVDTAGFTASAMRMSDADALAGRLRFGDATTAAGALSVQGNVLARSGDVVLLGSRVDTGASALVQAPNGSTILGAGQQIEITGRGLEGIVMQVQAPTDSAVNLGTLKGDAVGIFAGTLTHSGHIEATRVSVEGGKVILQASADALVQGTSQTLARSANGQGGDIQVLGHRVGITDSALVDASGATGGGTVLVGGDYQGKNPDVQNATISYVGSQTTIKADATDNGNGGKIIVWADDTTRAFGTLSAQGGTAGGDGGLIETSGHRYLDVAGARVNTLAPMGKTGTWLLDPTDITIVHGGATQANPFDGTGLFNVGGQSATLNDGDINLQLLSTDITVQTASAGTATGNIVFDSNTAVGGAISINNASTSQAGQSLTLNADGQIIFRGPNGTTFSATGAPLSVVLNPTTQVVTEADSSVRLDGVARATQAQLAAGKTWDNFGTLSINGDAAVVLESAATLNNKAGGVVQVNSTNSNAFQSTGNSADGVINNDGTINVAQFTAFDAEYNQSGTLTIQDTTLGLSNVNSVSGTIDLAPGSATTAGTLNVTRQYTHVANFHDLNVIHSASSVTGESAIQIGSDLGPVDATFTLVNAPLTTLGINVNGFNTSPSTATITGGGSVFSSLYVDPTYNPYSLVINNGTLGLTTSSLDVSSSNTTFTGNVGLFVAGSLNVQSAFTTTGNLHLISGWNGNLSIPAANDGASDAPLNVLGALSAAKLSLESSDSVVLDAALTATGDLDIRARTGDIAPNTFSNVAQTHALSVTGATKLIASGYVYLVDSGNTLTSLEVNAGGSVGIAAASGLSLGNVTGSSVNLDAAGAITQGASQSITTTGDQFNTNTNGNGGAINVYGSSLALGTVNASGVTFCTDGGCGDGGSGGNVLLHAKSGNFSGTIISRGGDGDATQGGNGGAGGTVDLVMNGVEVNGVAVPNSGVASLTTSTFQTQGGVGTSVGSILGTNGTAGTWRVYADSPAGVTKGGLTSDFRHYSTTYANYQGSAVIETGNGFIYASAPGALKVDTTLASGTGSHTYGNTPDAVFGYTLSGFADSEDNANNIGLAGTAAFTNSFAASTNAGSYTQLYDRGLTSSLGYSFAAQNGYTYTVNKRPITIGANAITKTYDGSTTIDTTLSGNAPIVVSGSLFSNDALSGGSLAFADPNAGVGNKTVNASGVVVTDGNNGGNYLLSYLANTTSTINKRDITLASLTATSRDYDGTDTATITDGSFANLAGSETLGISGSGSFADRNAANAKVVTVADVATLTKADGTGLWSNYNLTTSGSATTTASIAKKAVTLSVGSVSKTYDGALAYTAQTADLAALGTQLGVTGDSVSAANIAFADKNVGTGNKAVTLGGVTVSDGNAGDNYTVTLVGNNSSNITQAASASWVGGSTGLWSQASNWTALPDGTNVLAVNIPSGITVTFDANAADTTLQALNSLGTLAVTGSNLAITNALVTSQFNQTGGTVGGAGSFTVGSSFSQTAGSIAMGGAVSINQASGDLALASVQGSSIGLQAASGAVRQTGALVTDGLLTVRATDGIDLANTNNAVRALLASNTGTGDLLFVNKAVLDVQGITVANGNVDIDNTGGFGNSGPMVARGGTVDVRTHSPLSINNSVVAGGNITLEALTDDGTSNITINSPMTSTGGGISIQAYNNFIQNSGLSAALKIDVSTVSGSLLFGPSAFSVGNPISYAANGVSYVPPWIAAAYSGGATDFVATFLGQFEAALEEQYASSDDPLGLNLRAREGVTVEGEICKP